MSYSTKSFMLKSSERYCLIVDHSTHLPVYYPNLFITTQIRNKSESISTMLSTAASLIIFLKFLSIRDINIEERIYKKQFLSIYETDDLRDFSQKRIINKKENNVKTIKEKRNTHVASQTQYARLTIIYKYIEWLSYYLVENQDDFFAKNLTHCLNQIKERRPNKKGRNNLIQDKSLNEQEIESLFEVIRVGSDLNPFNKSVQRRNRLIILMLYYFGIRGGELLNIKISDIDFSSNQLSIRRRADDKSDTRIIQPLVKTNERVIPITESLAKEIHFYVLNERRFFVQKRKHDYLFVNHKKGNGLPLTYMAYSRIINNIKNSTPNLKSLTGHMLRHTWNSEFSKRMDSMDNPPSAERQEQLRSYLMGWKAGSGTAAHYNKRFIHEKSHQVALLLQERIGEDDNE
ncbi:site-specific integrase [Pectobacterium sp. 1950-15]|uniref:tyrosine-type recombinase/integrase n=1 Tax=Pectobacterium sp. 1950-15 TaxID=3128982 RepID=UPI00301A0222